MLAVLALAIFYTHELANILVYGIKVWVLYNKLFVLSKSNILSMLMWSSFQTLDVCTRVDNLHTRSQTHTTNMVLWKKDKRIADAVVTCAMNPADSL